MKGKISNKTMMRKMLERFDEVGIVDETNGFGLDFVKKTVSFGDIERYHFALTARS